MVHPTVVLANRSAAFQVEAAVIGAGVIGLAIGRALSIAGKEVIILDRAGAIGSETSSRNSEVIHAGLYYPQNSLKAQFCVRGKQLLYDYCQSRNISHLNCGKLIVATQEEQLDTQLPSLQQHAIQNGVHDTQIITAEDVKTLEPNVQCAGALWSPSTGVLDSHSFMVSLLADAEDHGATLALHSNLVIDTAAESLDEMPTQGDDINNGIYLPMDDDTRLQCKIVINSTGLWAHHVARTIHHYNNNQRPQSATDNVDNPRKNYSIPQQYFAKGNYFRLEGYKNPFHHLVYPLPEPGGLGVHATIDYSGQTVKFGPDVEWISAAVDYADDIDLSPHPDRADRFYEQVRKYWPDLPDNALVPDYAGIRPKLYHPSPPTSNDTGFRDFCIATPDEHGIPGLIHLFGMESPGLTGSMAIGEYIAQQVALWD